MERKVENATRNRSQNDSNSKLLTLQVNINNKERCTTAPR